jgi:hypothetical protein
MNVQRQDNILRYLVDSRTRVGVQHVVELDHYDGNGGCTCEDFSFRLEPMLKKGAVVPPDAKDPDALRCEHIKAARRKLVDDIIAQVAHKPELATNAQEARQRVERKPPPRYKGKARKTRPRPASERR